MITPNLGRILTACDQRCGFSSEDADATTCGKPATWHICWGADMDCGLTCEPHMEVARTFAYLDRHQIGPDCDMPGAGWSFDEKRCTVEGVEHESHRSAALTLPLASGDER